jgi:pyruvyltransferase
MAILARLEKVRRYLAGRLAPADALPVLWHVGRPNFGDDINPSFFARVSGRPVRLATDRRRPHILGAGSILERASPAAIICGSGFLNPPQGPVTAAEIVAVRGSLSLAACPRREGVLLGDPLVLVDAFAPQVGKRHRFGFVPHVTAADRWRRLGGRGLHIIHPGWSPWRVIEEIASCEAVFSQSLHGLIVADAVGVPNVWIAPSDAMAGGRFKFDDYFSTLDRPKEPVPESRDLFSHPHRHQAGLGRYRFSKADYRQRLAAACARLAARRAAGPEQGAGDDGGERLASG